MVEVVEEVEVVEVAVEEEEEEVVAASLFITKQPGCGLGAACQAVVGPHAGAWHGRHV